MYSVAILDLYYYLKVKMMIKNIATLNNLALVLVVMSIGNIQQKTELIYMLKYGFYKKYYRYPFVMKNVFNWSELHLSEVTSYKIHTLVVRQHI